MSPSEATLFYSSVAAWPPSNNSRQGGDGFQDPAKKDGGASLDVTWVGEKGSER